MLDIVNFEDGTLTKRNLVNNTKHEFEFVLLDVLNNKVLGYGKTKEVLLKNKFNSYYTPELRNNVQIFNNPEYINF